jgi:hypothetical protein
MISTRISFPAPCGSGSNPKQELLLECQAMWIRERKLQR